MNLFKLYQAGGTFMHFISIFALITLVVVFLKARELILDKKGSLKLLDLILMSGSLSLAIGLLGQIIGIVLALAAIRDAADISPQIVFNGAIVSFYAPIWGFIVFIFSILSYFILKEVIRNKKKD